MAVYDLEEQEQLDEIKTWWKQYGNLVTAVVVVVAVGMVGWQGWNWWQRDQSTQAAAVYAVVERAAGEHDAKKAREATGELIDKFSGTAYASLAALLSAKMQVTSGDLKTAKLQLGWAADNARDSEVRDLARLRLAAVLLDEKAYDEALKQLAGEPALAFFPRYSELKGDIFAAQGKQADAKTAYQAALNKLDEIQKTAGIDQHRGQYRDLVQVKLESLGGKQP
ncbi:MAG: tetratricopeptide repeat protein [Sterolibacterium sp.]|nr:tetratricopeptide repeat protein [Sterolibacterium sp.]